MPFLGSPLSSTLVYIWSRRNPETRLSFLGLLVFTAPYLPWVLMGFSFVLHGSIPKDELMGVAVGHGVYIRSSLSASNLYADRAKLIELLVYYFFSDVYPPLSNGARPFDPPRWWRRLFEAPPRQHGTDTDAAVINHDIAAPAPVDMNPR
jgi:Derlin-2/3